MTVQQEMLPGDIIDGAAGAVDEAVDGVKDAADDLTGNGTNDGVETTATPNGAAQ